MVDTPKPDPSVDSPDDDECHDSGVTAALASLEKTIASKKPSSFPKRALSNLSPNVVQLPLWPDIQRGVPNHLVRGALFTIGNHRTPRAYRKGMLIDTLNGVEIIYTGEELRQSDEDVFLQVVHLGRLCPLGAPIMFTAHSLLKALCWPSNSRSYLRLRESLARLQASALEVRTQNGGYSGSLIRDFVWKNDNDTGESDRHWIVRLEPRIAALFDHMSYTQIDWEQRLKLGVLAKWLHAFYYTHRTPYALKTETIRRLSGSTTRDLSKFRQLLRKALAELVEVGFLRSQSICIQTDLVYVQRAPSVKTSVIEKNTESSGNA
ncbi:plasmid replication initiator TrfA [Thiocystis violacea]|uniref:plasmid replication initiator TrfA n=1 Tax=Thiocystis violacea TaxID=13725 RepID=UPI0019044060|nr:plasmid replication initiator TrfA [Thiocystis violacea]MBK1724428.1 hypothetical protein [Thiocystis violacea]